MRQGQVVVAGILVLSLGAAGAAWLIQQKLLERHARPAPPITEPAPAQPSSYERTPVPGAIPAAPQAPVPTVAAAPNTVPVAWADKNREAIAALEAGDHARAIEIFEACHGEFPDMAVFANNLAEALARAAIAEHGVDPRCTLCIERLERAIVLAPERAELKELLERWQRERELEQDFWRESSAHFELSYDGTRRDLLWGSTRLSNELEKAYADLGDLFAFYPVEAGRPKFRVVFYERAGFSLMTGLGDWAGGAFDGSAIRIPIGDLAAEESRLQRVFRHELAHAFIRELGGDRIPGWLNEGLAQWLEHPSDARRIEEAAAATQSLAGEELIALDALEGSLASWKDEAAIGRAYRQSLAFTGYLWRQHGQRSVLAMIEGCKQGRTVAESFEKEVRLPLADALEAWERTRK